jgi:hypothetical protein
MFAYTAATAMAAEADLSRYAGSSSNLSAVVTAITLVEPCEGDITLSEEVIDSYQVVELTVACSSDADDTRTVILRFDMLEGGGLRPASFGRAG